MTIYMIYTALATLALYPCRLPMLIIADDLGSRLEQHVTRCSNGNCLCMYPCVCLVGLKLHVGTCMCAIRSSVSGVANMITWIGVGCVMP